VVEDCERAGEKGRASLWSELYKDYRRYRATGAGSWFGVIFLTQGFWAVCLYRLTYRLERGRFWPGLGPVLHAIGTVLHKAAEIVTGISLPPECDIAPGLYIGHFGPTVVHGAVRIGVNCNLSQGVTIGIAGRGENRGCPTLGDRIYVGPNAVIMGKISIGNDAAIGAGAIVNKAVPDRGVAVGNPASVISYRGSFEFVQYDGMETDPERLAALRCETRAADGPPDTK
jgi:serine O-acetyltransferase